LETVGKFCLKLDLTTYEVACLQPNISKDAPKIATTKIKLFFIVLVFKDYQYQTF